MTQLTIQGAIQNLATMDLIDQQEPAQTESEDSDDA